MARIEIVEVRREAEWRQLESEWKTLFRESPAAAPPLLWEWQRQWWNVYGSEYAARGNGLGILTARHDGRLVGVLPLYWHKSGGMMEFGRRRVGFISAGELEFEETCAEYLNLLALPDYERECANGMMTHLVAGTESHWDELHLTNVPGDSPLVVWANSATLQGVRVTVHDGPVCPIADLARGFETYLTTLSRRTRESTRRLLRRVRRSNATLQIARTPLEAATYFEQLVALHQIRWRSDGRPGCFAADRFHRFHRALVGDLLPSGVAVLARLVLGDATLAVIYGFVIGQKFDFYQSGVTIKKVEAINSPGVAAHLLLMQELERRNVISYDFLAGTSEYKRRLSSRTIRLATITMHRHSVPMVLNDIGQTGRRLVAGAWRRVRSRVSPTPSSL